MTSLATPILLTVMFALLVMGFAGFQQFELSTALSTRQAAQSASDRVRTQIEVQSVTLSDGVNLRLEVSNRGNLAITDFKYMDFIVDYQAVSGPQITRLSYTSGGTLPGQWRVADIDPDVLHPGLWNQGEIVTLEATLPVPVKVNSTGTAVIVTPNGITASTYFTR